MGYGGGGVNGTLRWTDLALNDLLPVDEDKEEMKRAIQARKMASGASNNNPQPQAHQPPQAQQIEDDEDDEDDENDENLNDDDEDEGGVDDDDDEEGEEEEDLSDGYE